MERAERSDLGRTLENVGEKVIRYELVIILLWVGALKFTAYEAEAFRGGWLTRRLCPNKSVG